MASIKDALFARLTTWPAIATLIGTRCYPEIAPQGALWPHLTYQRISKRSFGAMKGEAGGAASRFQVDCWAKKDAGAAAEADALAEAVRNCLGSFPWTEAGVFVQSGRIADAHDLSELEAEGGESPTRRISVDAILCHAEEPAGP